MKSKSRQPRTRGHKEIENEDVTAVRPQRVPQKVEPKTETQKRYLNAIKSFPLVFGLGPAGTGKTFLATVIAADCLAAKRTEQIIITRPAKEAGESLGFLPGEKEEKYSPYVAPVRSILDDRLGRSHVDVLLKNERIIGMPLAYLRGHTFKNCFVIFDEAQNATREQMKLFLTRIGDNCQAVVNGDETQVDIVNSGLADAVARVSWIPQVKIVRFKREDCVRSGICSDILASYEKKT